MSIAIDTVAFTATNPGAAGAAAVVNPGDSFAIRAFASPAFGRIDWLSRQGATEGFVQVKSPRFHDAQRGLQLIESETPAVRLLPQDVGQPVYPADNLTVVLSGGTAEVDAGAFGVYYSDLGGGSSRYYQWGDISGSVVNLKPVEVDVAAQATSGAWTDTKINATEDNLKADVYYAVLGYTVDAAAIAVGIKGPETGNYRCCGPGSTLTIATDEYFVRMAERHGRPYIPVINANNRNNIFVSTALVSTAATPKVQLILAELAGSFSP